jgi:hypothetical protein
MRSELSTVFHLGQFGGPVQRGHLGGGVWIEGVNPAWLDAVKAQCPKVAAREMLEYAPHYTHRMYVELHRDTSAPSLASADEQQPIIRAIALSRIVKPNPIAYGNAWITSKYADLQPAIHHAEFWVSGLSVAFVSPSQSYNTITDRDVSQNRRSLAVL